MVGGRGVGAAGDRHQERRTQPAGAEEQDQRRGSHEGVRQGGSERCARRARARQPTHAHSHAHVKQKKKMLPANHPLVIHWQPSGTHRTPHHSPAAAGSASASRSGRNPCQVNNGGCSQLCFPTSENSRSCSCTVGYNLRSDRMSCEGTQCNCMSVFTQHAFVIFVYLFSGNAYTSLFFRSRNLRSVCPF